MDTTAERSARKRARFATYDDEATGLGRVAPDASRWTTPDSVQRYRRAVILADRYRRKEARRAAGWLHDHVADHGMTDG